MKNSTTSSGRRTQKTGLLAALFALTGVAQAATLTVSVLDRAGKPAYDSVVIVVPSAGGVAKNPLPMQAVVNQEKMQFVPAVTVVSPGAKIQFLNNDAWDHHVRLSEPVAAGGVLTGDAPVAFSLRLAGKSAGKPSTAAEVKLDKPGAFGAALLSCLIHGTMSGHVYVSESPWAVKTDENGIASFDDLPEGAATIKIWNAGQLISKPVVSVNLSAVPSKSTIQLDIQVKRRRAI